MFFKKLKTAFILAEKKTKKRKNIVEHIVKNSLQLNVIWKIFQKEKKIRGGLIILTSAVYTEAEISSRNIFTVASGK